jgi:type VI secretion system secreted protein VgrG
MYSHFIHLMVLLMVLYDSLFSRFAKTYTQHHRLIALRFPETSKGIEHGTLLPARLNMTTALSEDTNIELVCLTADTTVELKTYLGQPVEISVLLANRGHKIIAGVVLALASEGYDGEFTTVVLTIGSMFQTLKHRHTSRVFQNSSVPDIVRAILTEHRHTNHVFAFCFHYTEQLYQTYPRRELVIQHNETDYAFIRRLLAEEGITYYHISGQADAKDDPYHSSDVRRSPIVHQFVITDHNQGYRTGSEPTLYFGADDKDGTDSLTSFTGRRQLTSYMTSVRHYAYQSAANHNGSQHTRIAQGERADNAMCTLEDYRADAAFECSDNDSMQRIATVRQQARDAAARQFSGTGTLRALDAGTIVTIEDHPVLDQDPIEQRHFLITSLHYQARNNLPDDIAKAWRDPDEAITASDKTIPCRVSFTAIRHTIPFAPAYTEAHQQPTAHGIQTATVVGPANEEIFTDEFGRIKIQFHFVRQSEHPNGGADFNAASFPWVRVANHQAGAGFGTQFIPRVGQEVIVDFINGNINLPIVIGVVHNGTHTNPWFSGTGALPANRTLSGFKTEGHKDHTHYNELLFDDTYQQSRTKLSSESGKTQLNLGYLVHPRTNGEGQARGQGFELRTDQHGALRAANGILISAAGKIDASGNQLDRSELTKVMQMLESVHQRLGKFAAAHQGDATDTAPFSALKTYLQQWENGTNTKGNEPDPTGTQALVAVSAPAGIVLGSQASIALAAENHIDIASAQNVQLSTARKLLARAAESISLFAQKLHIKLIAASGNVQIEAHSANIEMLAAKQIILNGLEEIILRAPKITFETNGAKQTWGNGNIASQCVGIHTAQASKHIMSGPGAGAAGGMVRAYSVNYDEQFVLRAIAGEALHSTETELANQQGESLSESLTNDRGETKLVQHERSDRLHIKF